MASFCNFGTTQLKTFQKEKKLFCEESNMKFYTKDTGKEIKNNVYRNVRVA